ncbi:MAG TPA: flagellar filament capping protein FliD [Cellulomonas sp.]|nr:flagellar filament capping protein FliD [Cellulomonas sp.]
MVSMGIDGMISGLNTTDLINQLMTAEAVPQTLLKTKQSETTSFITALQSFNAKVASLATSAATAALPASWGAYAATSSTSSVSATTTSSAQPSELQFRVDAVASNQVSLSDAFSTPSMIFPGSPPVITVKKADGTLTTINPASGDLAEITRAINAAPDSGVKAVAVKVGTSYRLQLSSTATGVANGFSVYSGSAADVTAGTATAVNLTSTRAAADAQVTLWPGSTAAMPVTSSSNSFSNVLDGVTFTVSKVEAAPVTLTVARDDAALAKLGSDLVGSLGVVFSEITSRTSSSTTTDSSGKSIVTGGLFSGDSAVRNLSQQLQAAAAYPINGTSPSAVGITIAKDGTFAFDAAKFKTALAADPAKVQSIMSGLAARVADVAKLASDPNEGSVSLKITGQQGELKDLGLQIDDWDRRLALRKSGLQATYTALEVSLSALKSQSSWLTSQIASLSTSSSTSG